VGKWRSCKFARAWEGEFVRAWARGWKWEWKRGWKRWIFRL